MKTKSLSIFLVALFVVEMNLGTEEDNNENKEDEKFKYEKINEVPADKADLSLKMILIGNSKVGKSALSGKICKNTFTGGYSPTLGFEFITLYFNIVSDMKNPVLKYEIWDCCGEETYRTLATSFFYSASVVLLAYDVTDEKSFKDIDGWVNNVKAINKDKTIHFVLIGTKIDLKDKRVVSKEDGKKFAQENGMEFVEVSAQTGDGIKELENILAKIIYEEFKDENNEKKDFVKYKKHIRSSSLCDCCKKICENC